MDDEERNLRRRVMRARLMPMLAGSVTPAESREPRRPRQSAQTRALARQARTYLDEWIDYAVRSGTGELFPASLKVALAQGFKYAANWRRLNPYSLAESRAYLAERAKDMLHTVDFWYSRIALLHALTLWSLPDGPDDIRQHRQPQSPDALVRQWMVMRDDEAARTAEDSWTEHPFVALAARLCVLALQTGQPERFVWIDESGVLSKTGSGPATTSTTVRRHLWIPPSAGWGALDPRAQQLVGDVLIFLNLAEDDQGPKDRERRLADTARPALPSCLTKDRTLLDPVQTIGVARKREPGSRARPG